MSTVKFRLNSSEPGRQIDAALADGSRFIADVEPGHQVEVPSELAGKAPTKNDPGSGFRGQPDVWTEVKQQSSSSKKAKAEEPEPAPEPVADATNEGEVTNG